MRPTDALHEAPFRLSVYEIEIRHNKEVINVTKLIYIIILINIHKQVRYEYDSCSKNINKFRFTIIVLLQNNVIHLVHTRIVCLKSYSTIFNTNSELVECLLEINIKY